MQRRTFISSAVGLGAAGLAMLLATPRPQPGQLTRSHDPAAHYPIYTGADLAFGTTIAVQVVHADQRQAELAIADALAAAKQIDRLLSLHRIDSQVYQLNQNGSLDRPHPHLSTVLTSAAALSRLTHGAFDVTVQPLWQTFSAAAATGALPSADARHAAMALVDWRQLAVSDRRVALARPGMAITLNGIAQGHAVDVAQAALAARGIQHAFLDTGEFAACGRKSNRQEWTIGIRDPRDRQALAGIVPMRGRCVATSGDYETVFTPDFVHHHIFDPASGDSPVELASVTVVAPTGLQADGWSTALMVLGADKALALAATLTEFDILLIGKDGRRWRSTHLPTLPA